MEQGKLYEAGSQWHRFGWEHASAEPGGQALPCACQRAVERAALLSRLEALRCSPNNPTFQHAGLRSCRRAGRLPGVGGCGAAPPASLPFGPGEQKLRLPPQLPLVNVLCKLPHHLVCCCRSRRWVGHCRGRPSPPTFWLGRRSTMQLRKRRPQLGPQPQTAWKPAACGMTCTCSCAWGGCCNSYTLCCFSARTCSWPSPYAPLPATQPPAFAGPQAQHVAC